ncbi:hypothetical protein D7Z26_09385 [Cohnella endophytica]|uniref:Uncharacterized protein n=1 Tax=Cohnella endophytica TaxID=2419778 RepID=A0A494XXV8_9BACL|nr:hypothetical protein D7Z26_09385 [Cohnella endophytica]
MLNSKKGEFHFFINAYFPFVAIARYSIGNEFHFLEKNELKDDFRLFIECNYFILTRELLEQPFTKEDIIELDKNEIKQYYYWKPETIKDIVFNN